VRARARSASRAVRGRPVDNGCRPAGYIVPYLQDLTRRRPAAGEALVLLPLPW